MTIRTKPLPPPFDDQLLNRADLLFSMDKRFHPEKKTLLIYMSCHGRTLLHYFTEERPDLLEKYNIIRLETGPMTIRIREGVDVFGNTGIKAVLSMADVVVTYNMGARMGP